MKYSKSDNNYKYTFEYDDAGIMRKINVFCNGMIPDAHWMEYNLYALVNGKEHLIFRECYEYNEVIYVYNWEAAHDEINIEFCVYRLEKKSTMANYPVNSAMRYQVSAV